jgi:hypothetical protein
LDYLTTHTRLLPIRHTRLAAASDKAYQLLAHGRWFSLGSPASSTTKTGRYDIAEILLKVALNIKTQSTFIKTGVKTMYQITHKQGDRAG